MLTTDRPSRTTDQPSLTAIQTSAAGRGASPSGSPGYFCQEEEGVGRVSGAVGLSVNSGGMRRRLRDPNVRMLHAGVCPGQRVTGGPVVQPVAAGLDQWSPLPIIGSAFRDRAVKRLLFINRADYRTRMLGCRDLGVRWGDASISEFTGNQSRRIRFRKTWSCLWCMNCAG